MKMEDGDLHVICYGSSATGQFEREDLENILQKARTNNFEQNITGLLLYRDGSFFQILEGPEEKVEKLFRKIELDPRHTSVIRMLSRSEEERNFGDWSMGFRDISESDAGAYSKLIEKSADADDYLELLPDWVLSLVQNFLRVNR